MEERDEFETGALSGLPSISNASLDYEAKHPYFLIVKMKSTGKMKSTFEMTVEELLHGNRGGVEMSRFRTAEEAMAQYLSEYAGDYRLIAIAKEVVVTMPFTTNENTTPPQPK